MLALCKIEYWDTDISSNEEHLYKTQCILSSATIGDIGHKLCDYYGEEIVSFTVTPLEDLQSIPAKIYDAILTNSWTTKEIEEIIH